jgi:hypothetical protein
MDGDRNDYEDGEATLSSGVKVKTRNYKDGGTTYFFGGPVGNVTYNSNGDETSNPRDDGPDSSPFSSRRP